MSLRERVSAAWRALTRNQATNQQVPARVARMYSSARETRLTADWSPSNTSADSELVSSLTELRARSRSLVRDVSYAKRAKVIIVNNVIGTGIGMQAQVMTSHDVLNDRVNDAIEETWAEWSQADQCHTGGRLSFEHLERALMGQVFEAGEVLVRKHYRPFGSSRIPFALELIEAERLADEFASPYITTANGNHVRMGVEVDEFYRPIAYHIRKRHPSEIRFSGPTVDMIERVPANEIIHLAVVDRWPQTRGEPWMHTALRTFNDIAGYTEAEITRARVQAATPWTIETTEDVGSFGEVEEDGSATMDVEPGVAKRLNPGEKMNAPSVNAPNPALDPFMRYMLREIAAGTGPSYESISRDYSQHNFSSQRLMSADDKDIWRFYQRWFICDFRRQVHREWLMASVLSRSIESIPVEKYAADPRKFEAALFKPRGWTFGDPAKEIPAYADAIKAGMMPLSDVIQQYGGGQDLEDVLTVRERELKLMKERNLVFETSPEFYMADVEKDKAEAKRAAKPPEPPPDKEEGATEPTEPAERRVFHFRRP